MITPTDSLESRDWSAMTYEEKNQEMYRRQKRLLAMFLERGAISKKDYDKSLHDMTEKMGLAALTE